MTLCYGATLLLQNTATATCWYCTAVNAAQALSNDIHTNPTKNNLRQPKPYTLAITIRTYEPT